VRTQYERSELIVLLRGPRRSWRPGHFPFAFNPSLKIRILFFSHVRTMKDIATPFRDHNQNKNKPRNEK
jgi:hypothetical protein